MTRRLGAAVALTAVLGLTAASGASPGALAPGQDIDLDGIGYALGSVDAPVRVIEFGDFGCSSCARFARATMPQIRTELIRTGKVHWTFVAFVLGPFNGSEEAGRAAACAEEQGGFWAMHDQLYVRQQEWMPAAERGPVFAGYADRLGLAVDAFVACYDSDAAEDRVDAANRIARRLRVRATPTFFIDGERTQGAYTYDQFLELLPLP